MTFKLENLIITWSGKEEEGGEGGEGGEGEPVKKKLRKRERLAKMFDRDGRATNIAEGFDSI